MEERVLECYRKDCVQNLGFDFFEKVVRTRIGSPFRVCASIFEHKTKAVDQRELGKHSGCADKSNPDLVVKN